jgi:regulator of sirC expression with transglutaminase-like and TPR domain
MRTEMNESARRRFKELLGPGRGQPPLAEAALVVASEEYADLNVRNYLARLHAFASVIGERARAVSGGRPVKEMPVPERLALVNHYLFDELGFRGNSEAYEDPRNSYLNEVIDRRLGIPLTLAIVYIEVAAGVAVRLTGVGFPGHFLVKTYREEPICYLDPFNRGAEVSAEELGERLRNAGYSETDLMATLGGSANRMILRRLLANLKASYMKTGDHERALAALERLLFVSPGPPEEIRDLGMTQGGLGNIRAAIESLENYLERAPGAADQTEIRKQVENFRYWESRRN